MPDMTTQSSNTGAEVQPLPRVLLCGDPRTAEFEAVVRDAASIVPSEAVSQVADLAALRTRLTDGEQPDLLVIVQTWPDEFHFADVLALPGIGPFSRLICCYGPWCVSDGRNRQDFPLSVRVPLEQFRSALCNEWQQLTGPGEIQSPLPWTAGRDEVFRARAVGPISEPVRITSQDSRLPSHGGPRPEIRVHSADLELSRLWLEALKTAGHATATADHEDSQIVLWDVDVWTDSIGAQWRALRHRFPATQIIALTGFAGPDLISHIESHGAALVLSKLLPLDTLVARIVALQT